MTSCNALCVATTDCAHFMSGKGEKAGKCTLFKFGCGMKSGLSFYDMYEAFDQNEMDNALMFNHILSTDQTEQIKCGDDTCSFVNIDRKSAGIFKY